MPGDREGSWNAPAPHRAADRTFLTIAGEDLEPVSTDTPGPVPGRVESLVPFEIPDLVADRYERGALLGRGGMGSVWRMHDRVLGRPVAMKVVRAGLVRQAALERFEEEVRIAAQLQHPAIIPVHDFGRLPDGRPWFVMQVVRGRTLEEAMIGVHRALRLGREQSDDGFTLRRLLELFLRACEAVAYAHARGVVHRDLKPANLMLGDYGEVFVLDWGLAKVFARGGAVDDDLDEPLAPASRRVTMSGAITGTPSYMATATGTSARSGAGGGTTRGSAAPPSGCGTRSDAHFDMTPRRGHATVGPGDDMRTFVAVTMVVALVGCPGGEGKGDAETLVFEEANNYEFEGTFTIETVETEVGAHFCIDWSAVTTDVRGRPFDPADVDQVALLQFDATQSQVLDEIDTNQLRQDDSEYQYLWDQPGGATSACTDAFEIIGQAFDPSLLIEESDNTWVVSLIDLDLGRNDVLTTAFVAPTTGSTNTDVTFTDATATLDYTVDIDGRPALTATADAGSWILDWSSITTDVNGVPFDPLLGDELLIAHYADYASVAEVEEVFLRLDTEATETYVQNVFGEVEADLSDAETSDGDGFGGFTTDGVWLVAISCTTCTSPVPMLLAWIDVK